MILPFDIRPVAPAHARGASFLISPRLLDDVRRGVPFAIVGYGELTALPGREDRWRWYVDPPPLPEAIWDAVPLPVVGLDVVFQDWSRAEAAVVVPLESVDVESLAARLDRRWVWLVDAEGQLAMLDRLTGTRSEVGPFEDHVGPRVFRSLERELDDELPLLAVYDGSQGFFVEVAFVPGDVDPLASTTSTLARVPDPTPDAGDWLTAPRLEALVDVVRQVARDRYWDVEVILGADLRLAVSRDGSVRPIAVDQSPEALLQRALGELNGLDEVMSARWEETRLTN